MRSIVMSLALGAAGVVLLAACGGSTSPYGGGGSGCTPTATKVCTTGSLQFNPASLTVAAGEWGWRRTHSHERDRVGGYI